MSKEDNRLIPLKVNYMACRREYIAGECFDPTGLRVLYNSGGTY